MNAYIEEKYPNIVIGSTAYVEFLTEQLMYESDLELKSRNNYPDFELYMSVFLAEANNPDKMRRQEMNDGSIVLQFNDVIKQRTLEELRMEIERQETVDEDGALNFDEFAESDISTFASVYSPSEAVAYAQKYALGYNSAAYDVFSSDCTNFVSQCLVAGGKTRTKPSNYTRLGAIYETTSYWYSMHSPSIKDKFYVSTSFIRVRDFYTYWKTRGALVTTGLTKAQLQSKAQKGDIVQLKNAEGSWYHSIIITSGSKGSWKYCGHTSNRKDYPVKDITGAAQYRILRFA